MATATSGPTTVRAASPRGLLRTTAALYVLMAANYAVPLLTIPYLIRTLGPVSWGHLAFGDAFARFLMVLLEGGFNLSATREIARHRDDPAGQSAIVSGVVGVQGAAVLVLLIAAVCLRPIFPAFASIPLFLASIAFAVCQGVSPVWFFQGRETLPLMVFCQFAAKAVAAVLIFLLVSSPAHAERALALQAAGSLAATIAGFTLLFRRTPFGGFSLAASRRMLAVTRGLFTFRVAVSCYTNLNIVLLGWIAPPQVTGWYAAAEKLTRAFMELVSPFIQAFYPRISYLAAFGMRNARRILWLSLVLAAGIGILASLVQVGASFVAAPYAGAAYAESLRCFRILAILPLVYAVNCSLGGHWLFSAGLERYANAAVIAAACLNIAVLLFAAPRWGHIGASWTAVTVELFIFCCLVSAIVRFVRFDESPRREAAA